MRRVTKFLTIIGLAGLLVSCGNFPAYLKPITGAKLDTGVTDYRHAQKADGKFTFHFFPQECTDLTAAQMAKVSSSCQGRGISDSNLIHENDSVSIDLLYGYICDFPEDANNWSELDKDFGDKENVSPCFNAESKAGVKGEVSILATVFERDGKKEITFSQEQIADENARVVYYSDDVRETGQPLNLSNLPMYGPVTYHGNPIYLRLAAVELDQKEVAETGAILRALASLGAKAYPPASPVLQTLEKVGGAFLESQQDDLFFQYDMQFSGDGGVSPVSAPLAAGLMSFVRIQNRSKKFNWGAYCLDKTTGKIRTKNNATGTCTENLEELKKHTYFTIQVRKNEPALKQDAFQTFAELNSLSAEDAQLPKSLGEFFSKAEQEIEKTSRFDRARSLAIELKSPSQVKREQAREAFYNALCLGYSPASESVPASLNPDQQLSTKKRYKLLELLEAHWPSDHPTPFDAKQFLSSATMLTACGNRSDVAWNSLFAQSL